MTPPSWLDDEPRASACVRQAWRLAMLGLKRPTPLVVMAVLLVTLVVGVAFVSKRSYAPSVVLRIVEAQRDPAPTPSPKRQLAEYVRQAVFTSEPLLALIRRHELYPSLARKNPRAAVDSFREDTDVEVYDNYFLEDRAPGRAPRSARLAVSFHGSDPAVAVAVTQALAALIVDRELATRRNESIRTLARAEREASAAELALDARRLAIATLVARDEPGSDRDPRRQIELVGLLGSIPGLERVQESSDRRAATLTLGSSLESRGLGLRFEVVDDGLLSTAAEQRDERGYLVSLSLFFGLPLVAMAVGAFDPRRGRA